VLVNADEIWAAGNPVALSMMRQMKSKLYVSLFTMMAAQYKLYDA